MRFSFIMRDLLQTRWPAAAGDRLDLGLTRYNLLQNILQFPKHLLNHDPSNDLQRLSEQQREYFLSREIQLTSFCDPDVYYDLDASNVTSTNGGLSISTEPLFTIQGPN